MVNQVVLSLECDCVYLLCIVVLFGVFWFFAAERFGRSACFQRSALASILFGVCPFVSFFSVVCCVYFGSVKCMV